jgi:hypothetical protein
MARIVRRYCAAALLLVFLGACDSKSGPDPSGDYQVKGEALNKRPIYTGRLRIESRGPGYDLIWLLGQREIYRGKALYTDNVLAAVYWAGGVPTPDLAVGVYRISGGDLTGTWIPATGSVDDSGREVLKGSPMLAGSYEIALGENPDGSTYSGHVEIAHAGRLYELRWYLPDLTYVGRGVRLGDRLVVGYASRGAPGVVAYCMTDDDGKGVWSYGNAKGMGTELISRSVKKDAFGSADIVSIELACKPHDV